jgi:hypothetical protein
MASTYSALKIELIGTGDQSGAWGNTTNANLGTALEEAIVGRATADFVADANLTLTLTNTNASQVARHFVLNVTSSTNLTVTRDLIVPAIEKPYVIQNNTSGGQSIRVIVAGASVTVPNGRTAFVYNDGVDIKAAFDWVPALTIPVATITGGTINGTTVGASTPSTGTFTTLTTPAATITGGTINDTTVGASTPSTGAFTTLTTPAATITGGTINGTTVGASTPSTGSFTTLTASQDSSFTSTGAVTIPVGTTVQRPTGAVGKIRWNSTLNQYEGYDGSNWTLLGGAVITNDTTTTTNLYPTFAGVTSGNVSTLFTGNAKLLYKPSTGELQSSALWASNGFVVNAMLIAESYTLPAGTNAMTAGPITIDNGVTVTVPNGSTWTVV